jgi:glutaredoxin-dependent peroxiredoxin
MPILPGQKAPAFSLYDTDKKLVSLSDFTGKNVLLLFFPLAFTSVCTKELCGVRDNISFYNDVKATVLGISVDSLYTLKKFKEEQQLNFSLLSDFNREASTAYDCLYEEFSYSMKKVSKRAAFIIDGQGIVRYAETLENASEVPNFSTMAELLQKLP